MEIKIKVFAESSSNKIVGDKDRLNVYVKAKKRNYQANDAARQLLAKHFKTEKESIIIKKGMTSKYKLVEVT